jgi:uncharacterized protein
MTAKNIARNMKRLSPSELEQLGRFLDGSPGAMPLPQARGFLAAMASTPEMIMPSTWLPMVIGEPDLNTPDAASGVALLVVRLYNQILDDLNAQRPVSPDDEEELSLWCRGYLAGTALDDHWLDDKLVLRALTPFAALAGELDLVGEEDNNGNIIEDPTPHLERYRDKLPELQLQLHQHWNDWRREHLVPPGAVPAQRRTARRVGRNEKCPCGSGLKYKRCCGR